MNSQIKFFFQNSQYYRNYNNVDHIVSNFEKIKNRNKASKELYKKKLFLMIQRLLDNKIDNNKLEKYILFLIEKYNFEDFFKFYKINILDDTDKLSNLKIINNLARDHLCDILEEAYNSNSIYIHSTRYFTRQRLNSCQIISNMKTKIKHNDKKYIKYVEK